MRIDISSFRGEAPRLTPRALPPNGAQIAKNARLQSGDLEAWRQFALTKVLANSSDVRTIYLLNGEWLSWTEDVDVARGIIPGDDTFRVYLTGPDFYDQPRWTDYALATTGLEPFPVTTRPLGVPNPDTAPSLTLGVSTAPTSNTTTIVDSGDQLDSAWTTSPPITSGFTTSQVVQDSLVGNGPPSYRLDADENSAAPAYLYRDFGLADSQIVRFSVDFRISSGGGADKRRMQVNFMASSSGAGIFASWTEAGVLAVGISQEWSSFNLSPLDGAAIGAPTLDIWHTLQVQVVRNTDGSRTVTAGVYNGSAQIGESVVVTNAFINNGGYFGGVLHVGEDAATVWRTRYDNWFAIGTSPTDPLLQTATSYVYTFVNDLGEESGPSPASATVLKDDGTAITVTTPVAVQSGFSADYGVATKRIYRAVTGNTGTAFLFVAEIPLSQADYVDELTDSELGDALETEDWELPPDDLRGILALPNGIMVGFRRNQLCFSAQNRPHAWPIKYRLNTDTDIVAIGNIDNTVVIGTKAFLYVATGNDPSAYSMSKLEVPQACVSKRSLAYLTNIGVVFASPDGLIAISGNGRVSNLTDSIFTRKQWQALAPETLVGIAHDDVYHFFSGATAAPIGVEIFEASGTWTKGNAVSYEVRALGAGGGAGGGAQSGGSLTPSGGGGGGGGARLVAFFDAADLPDTVAVTVGTGGSGGVGGPSGGGIGSPGTVGGPSSFGAFLVAYGGGAGDGGRNNAVAGGGGGGAGDSAAGGNGGSPAGSGGSGGVTGGGAGGTGAAPGGSVITEVPGAGGGGGFPTPTAGGSALNGGAGGGGGGASDSANNANAHPGAASGTTTAVPTAAAGGAVNSDAADGMDPTDLSECQAGSGGGGGGGSGSNVAGVNTGLAGNGGRGGKGAGGGGGGGVYASLGAAANGGDGGDGLVAVIAHGVSADDAASRLGFALDMKQNGFGLIELGYHALAAHADPLTDQLYLVLDEIEEPAEAYLPQPSTTPTLSSGPRVQIFEFDSPNTEDLLVYQWLGKLNRLAYEAAFTYCQVKADDYDNIVLNLYGDGNLLFTQVIVSKNPFTLPMLDSYETCEIELVGTSRIESVRLGETIEELMQEG